jgi:hypothetical protein
VAERASYGYRRVTALLNRQLEADGRRRVNRKRVYRIMRLNDLLLPRYRGRRERTHDGVVVTLKSNLRWSLSRNKPLDTESSARPVKTKERGVVLIHIDPRFTRTSAMADVYVGASAGPAYF